VSRGWVGGDFDGSGRGFCLGRQQRRRSGWDVYFEGREKRGGWLISNVDMLTAHFSRKGLLNKTYYQRPDLKRTWSWWVLGHAMSPGCY
jgi:hypothetical protein